MIRAVRFVGSALDDLRAFPKSARQQAGFQLDRVQRSLDPLDWKPMASVGKGVREIRVREAAGAFRVIYVVQVAKAVYVLHCFQKKTQRTAKSDLELAGKRYRDVIGEVGR
ncbi:type II toxin-antitoxin system RelE/ParE family toxin [Marinivivus vitaminiproducens]|uniref:type II toxin-antitoxin system RelE/ParE family toxin n=1 Tax=Marinivivus vitaminiproducens TaxID=3035935 RepID=UPI0027A11632|nr:type II toxin-antitoxin system RelE/ParE family toxin [Geminicoccaceae bacterium SCSIO 64248]